MCTDIVNVQSCGLCQTQPAIRQQGDQPTQIIIHASAFGLNDTQSICGNWHSLLDPCLPIKVQSTKWVLQVQTSFGCREVHD
jgi:hypothetical protein